MLLGALVANRVGIKNNEEKMLLTKFLCHIRCPTFFLIDVENVFFTLFTLFGNI